jgi:hypothetical protein
MRGDGDVGSGSFFGGDTATAGIAASSDDGGRSSST